ncbi:MAG: sigma-70 family RNA polymerase sigma factor [bacterium]
MEKARDPDLSGTERVPAALFRAMGELLVRHSPGLSRWALARQLRNRVVGQGIPYHERSVRRLLTGGVATVPQVLEDQLRGLVAEAIGIRDPDQLRRHLAEAGLAVPEAEPVNPYLSVGRVELLARLWLHFNPQGTKRSLAHVLSRDLARQGVALSPGHLEGVLAGKGRSTRREVLERLLVYLAPHSIASEEAARRAAGEQQERIDASLSDRELVPGGRFHELGKVWQWRRRGASLRELAGRLQQELAQRGTPASFDHLQRLLSGRQSSGRRAVLFVLEELVRSTLPGRMSLEEALAKVGDAHVAAVDVAWVKAAPIAELGRQWQQAHPEASRRQLALRVAQTARRMGFALSQSTVQAVLSGQRTRTHGFVYRAALKQLGDRGRERVPSVHILDPGLRAAARSVEFAGERVDKRSKPARVPSGATDAMSSLLAQMGAVPPLSREREEELARSIEQGEREIIEAVLSSPLGQRELAALAQRLRSGQIQLNELIRDSNRADLDPASRRAAVLLCLDRVGELSGQSAELARRLGSTALSARRREQLVCALDSNRRAMGAAVEEAHLAHKPIAAVARRLKTRIHRALKADDEIQACARSLGLDRTELVRQLRAPEGAELFRADRGLSRKRLREIRRIVKRAERWVTPLERNALLPQPRLRPVYEALDHGERLAEQSRSELVKANLRLVIWVARKHLNRGLPLLDLVQEGSIGLLRAVDKFDYRRGYRFATYALWWLRQAVARAIADQGRTIRIPVHAMETIRDIARTSAHLSQELGREPRYSELATALDMSIERVQALHLIAGQTLSLQSPVGEEADAVLADFIPDEEALPASEAYSLMELTETVQEALSKLSPREQLIIRMRFGINGEPEHSLQAVGDDFGITRERVRQIEARALAKLRRLSAIRASESLLRE